MKPQSQIECPECGAHIDVQEVLSQQMEHELQQKYKAQMAANQKALSAKEEELRSKEDAFEQKRKQQNEIFQEKLKKETARLEQEMEDRAKLARKDIEQTLRKRLQDEQAESLEMLQKEIHEKTEKLRELSRTKTELEKVKRDAASQREEMQLEMEKRMTKMLEEERQRIETLAKSRMKEEANKQELTIIELKKQLADVEAVKNTLEQKLEQGSMQLQGEAQEIAIESWLKQAFPQDEIEGITTGARGGDCFQTVNAPAQPACGSIYYESKRTKNWQGSWIEKFKGDMRMRNATFGVIVTQAMPPGEERMCQIDNIWICSYEEFKALCHVLRNSVILLNDAQAAQQNKGDKMSLLYDFLTGSEFRMQVEAIVEGFTQMQMDLMKERNAMESLWKKREKQLTKVVLNTTHMYSAIKGIAGNAIGAIQQLELGQEQALLEDSQ